MKPWRGFADDIDGDGGEEDDEDNDNSDQAKDNHIS